MDGHAESVAAPRADRAAFLLRLGMAAGPFYIVVGLAHALVRDGFDMRRYPLSLLSLGDLGWIQIGNFLVSGALVVMGAIGVRRLLRGSRGGTWGPILLALYGVGLAGAGIFPPDPADGFPPGAVAPSSLSTSGMLHFVFGALGFYALIAACFVFARRFWPLERRAWAVWSLATGVGFLLVFMGIASGSTAPAMMLAFYAAVGCIWVWHSALMATLAREASSHGSSHRPRGRDG